RAWHSPLAGDGCRRCSSCRSLGRFEVLCELVEPSLPSHAALLDPPAGIIEGPPSQLAPPDSALFVCLHQACLLESSNVLQDPRQRDVQGRSQLREGQRSGPQAVENYSSMTN